MAAYDQLIEECPQRTVDKRYFGAIIQDGESFDFDAGVMNGDWDNRDGDIAFGVVS